MRSGRTGHRTLKPAQGLERGRNGGDDDDDRPFIVLTETKSSYRHIPVWARYSPHPGKGHDVYTGMTYCIVGM
jgi:hypothetical protein